MNARILIGIFCLFLTPLHAQVLRDMNFNYQYSPTEPFNFSLKVIKQHDMYRVFYEFSQDTIQNLGDVTIQFETRESLSEKTGTAVSGVLSQPAGSLNFSIEADHKILVAVVTIAGPGKPKKFIYHRFLPSKDSPFVISDNGGLTKPFITGNRSIRIEGSAGKSLYISYYETPFPASAPAFSTTQSKVSKTIKPDSIFTVADSTPLTLAKKGLYLAQYDTTSAEGVAFRVEGDYPKLATLQSLAGPLLYICTKQENEKIKQAGNDKKKFDQVILTITGNADRARSFIRSYFKRVEYANTFFTSYKEGWKTDRGMIYIIFGPPDEVYLFDDREIWEYHDENNKNRFQFVKSPTLFDPNNFVLIRDKRYTTTWYKTVDLWRKARF